METDDKVGIEKLETGIPGFDFIADGGLPRVRTIEILKFRGTMHQKGEYPFMVISNKGVVVIPISAMQPKQKPSDVRITSVNRELDGMCGGGFFRNSIILVSGATVTVCSRPYGTCYATPPNSPPEAGA